MKTALCYLLDQILKRCPVSGRVVGIRRDTHLARLLFPLVGLLAIAWYLLRTLPEPRRADYPCQKAAAGIGLGFLAYLGWLVLTVTGLRFIRRHVGATAAVLAAVAVAAFVYCSDTLGQAKGPGGKPFPTEPQVFTSPEGVNKPMGEGKGIFPGRVVWVQDFKATKWDGQTGHWWEEQNIDQPSVDKMLSDTLQNLTGTKSDAAAWEQLFRSHNKASGRGDRGYQKGEKIALKVNLNPDEKPGPWADSGYPSPHTLYAMVRELIEVAGVPGDCITIMDPSRPVRNVLVSKIKDRTEADFQKVRVVDKSGGPEPWRSVARPDTNAVVHFQMPDGKALELCLPQDFTEATYLIDYAVVRPHRVFGLTMSFKNFFGAVYDPGTKAFTPSKLHAFALWDYATPYKHGSYNGLVPLLGHKNVAGKIMLYFADGLYTSPNQGVATTVVRWSTLGNRWFSSMLASQDPVALDSVGYDLVCTEPNLTHQPDGRPNPSFNGNVDGYLHEAALADHPPSKAKYEAGDGSPLKSLGVHEHWNNAKEMKYSRNLGKSSGIELVRISAN